jgi:hypothetical protein
MGDDVLERREPHLLRREGIFQPRLDLAPARQAAGEEGMPDAPIQNPPASYWASNSSQKALSPSDGAFTGIM